MAIKKQTIETVVCDICGEVADGEYNSVVYCNGDVVAERYCPYDLCHEHMGKWFSLCEDQSIERYDGRPREEKRAEMLADFIRLMGE